MHVGLGKTRGGLGIWWGGCKGSNGGQGGAVYEQPGTEVDDSYHNWRVPSKWKQGLERDFSKGNAPCIDAYIVARVRVHIE
jgi:hypothetical protein